MFGVIARKTVFAGVGILGAATTLFFLVKYHRYINVALEATGRALLFSIAIVSSAMAGTHMYFGGQLSMLVDRMTILSDLVFYSLVVGFCFMPLAIYRAVERAIKQPDKEQANTVPAPQGTPSEKQTGEPSLLAWGVGRAKGVVGKVLGLASSTMPGAMVRRAGNIAAPKKLPEKLGKYVLCVAIAPAALLALVATVSHLGATYAVVFLVVASVIAVFVRKRTVTARLMFASVFGIAFGLAHGLHISEVTPNAHVHLTSQGDVVHGTVLMNANSGAILIKPNKRLALIPWSLIRTIEIAPGPPLSSRMAKLEVHGARAAQFLREKASAFAAQSK